MQIPIAWDDLPPEVTTAGCAALRDAGIDPAVALKLARVLNYRVPDDLVVSLGASAREGRRFMGMMGLTLLVAESRHRRTVFFCISLPNLYCENYGWGMVSDP